MVTDEMVEKAARAMCEAWHYSKIGTPDGDAEWRKKQDQYRKQSRAALEAALSDEAPPIRLPTALSLMIEKGVDPEQNGYCRVIDVEKFLCAKLGKEWSATGMSIVSLVDELSALSAQVQDVADSELAYKEARQLAVSLHAEHYRDVTQWRPLDDLRGVISQIDNMVCGLVVKREGWQIVPKEPTPEMVVAAKSTTSAVLTKSHATEIYSAMLAAAPAKQEGGHD